MLNNDKGKVPLHLLYHSAGQSPESPAHMYSTVFIYFVSTWELQDTVHICTQLDDFKHPDKESLSMICTLFNKMFTQIPSI